eukprot:TRINITY_DN392_c0_g1_i2.p1 TRINITY_DN392_c0_g1~~TRINITY_DN392_c0_g1_i2.p1  ORF type:complete len:327 (-),score=91.35 TRINITY_DN392_c0_g1_i2:239-1219(-)
MTDIYQKTDPSRITTGRGVVFVNEKDARAALDDVRKPTSTNTWALLAFEKGSSENLAFVASGASFQDLHARLSQDIFAYALVRVMDNYEGIPTARFALIIWIGDAVSGIVKAKIAAARSTVFSFIGHYNVDINTSDLQEITGEEIAKKISQTSGSSSREVGKEKAVPHVPQVSQPKASSVVPKTKAAITFEDEAGLKRLLAEIRSDQNPTNWCLITYKDMSTLHLLGKGNGGLSELSPLLTDKIIAYGLLRQEDVVDQSVTIKFLFVDWLGESVPPMQKGKISTHKGQIKEFFDPYHIEVRASSQDDITLAAITAKINELKGFRKA